MDNEFYLKVTFASQSYELLLLHVHSQIEFLNDDPRTPFYHLGRKCEKRRSPKVVADALKHPPMGMVCSAKPRRCQRNAAFIINASFLDDPNDCLSDDLGPFRHNGQKRWYFVAEEDKGFVEVEEPETMEEGVYVLEKKYWVHLENDDFRRRLWRLRDWTGEPVKYTMVEYSFKGEEHKIDLVPHRNSKETKKPFLRTERSTKEMVKSLVKGGKKPSEVYDAVFEEKGGLMKAESLSSLPRQSQASKFKSAQRENTEKDELWTIANMSKEEAKDGNPFVRFPDCSTGNVFLADDRQMEDIRRFCTNPQRFGVLGVDTVFNCGNFYATPTTYPHLLLVDKTTMKCPTMLGPVSVHKRLNTECYDYLAASMTRAQPALRNILSIGSDGDSKIFNGMKEQFPASTWVLCKKHVEDNVRRKLTSLGITTSNQQVFVTDIFGNVEQNKRGLADCSSRAHFDDELKALKGHWDQKELSIRNVEQAQFHSWFMRYKSEEMKERMLYPVRRDIGLGYDYYYNNANESINNSVKRKKDYKRCKDIVEFADEIREIKDIQQRNIERAVIGEGPYRLRKEYSEDLEVEPDEWFHKMSPAQRQRHIDKLMTADVKPVEAQQEADARPKQTDATCHLSVSFKDSGLSSLMHAGSWLKASELVQKQNSMYPAPGTFQGQAFFVESTSGGPSKPNYVVMKPTGGLVCDCDKFKETRICSHSIAVSERHGKLVEHLQWFRNAEHLPNLSALASRGGPLVSGQKPGAKRQRSRTRNPPSRNESLSAVDDAPKEGTSTTIWHNKNPFQLMFLTSSQKKCISCKQAFNKGNNAPFNLCLSHKERYEYPFNGDFHDIRQSVTEKNFYYHLDLTCVRGRHPTFQPGDVAILESVRGQLKESHKRLLKDTMGI